VAQQWPVGTAKRHSFSEDVQGGGCKKKSIHFSTKTLHEACVAHKKHTLAYE
jgi:hypothetical protein